MHLGNLGAMATTSSTNTPTSVRVMQNLNRVQTSPDHLNRASHSRAFRRLDYSNFLGDISNGSKQVLSQMARLTGSMLPWLVIGALAVISVTLKLPPVKDHVQSKIFMPRDHFLGITITPAGEMFVAGQNGQILTSKDNGQGWTPLDADLGVALQDIAAWDNDHILAIGNDGAVVTGTKTNDQWALRESTIGENTKLLGLTVQGNGEAWAVGDMGAIFHSTDYGVSWNRASPVKDIIFNSIDFLDERIGIVVGEFGTIARTSDGGATWHDLSDFTDLTLLDVDFSADGRAVIVGQNGTVLISDDAGKHWSQLPAVTTEHLFDVEWDANEDEWVAVGNMGVISRTVNDDWKSWTASRIDDRNLSWHTGLALRDGSIYVSGQDTGIIRDGSFLPFQKQPIQ